MQTKPPCVVLETGIFYLPSSWIVSCVGSATMVMWCLHLTRPCCVALGQVLIWVVSPNWLRSFVNWVSSFPSRVQCFSQGEIKNMLMAGIVSSSVMRSTGAEWSLLPDHRSTPKPPRLDLKLALTVLNFFQFNFNKLGLTTSEVDILEVVPSEILMADTEFVEYMRQSNNLIGEW